MYEHTFDLSSINPAVRAQRLEASALVCGGHRRTVSSGRRPVSWGEKVSADWESIYRLCAPSLGRCIHSRLPEALVEDTLQDTFVRPSAAGPDTTLPGPALPWLLSIARRACAEALRK